MKKAFFMIAALFVLDTCSSLSDFLAAGRPDDSDVEAPSAQILSPTNNQIVGEYYTFSALVTDDKPGPCTLEISLDGTAAVSVTVPAGYFSTNLRVTNFGAHTNSLIASDADGNASAPQSVAFERTSSGWIVIDSLVSGAAVTNAVLTVSGRAGIDAPYSITRIEVSANGGAWSAAAGTTNWTTNVALALGYNAIAARAVCGNGKTNLSATISAFQDAIRPQCAIASPTNHELILTTNLSVTGTASDDYAVESVWLSVDGDGFGRAAGTVSWSTNVIAGDDERTLRVYCLDRAGYSSATNTLTVTVLKGYEEFPAKNIVFAPPLGPANPCYTRGRDVTVTAPFYDKYGEPYLNWKFDFDGDGVWDTGWQSSRFAVTQYADGGAYRVIVLATNRWRRGLYDNNYLSIDGGSSGNFTETGAGSLTGVSSGSVALGDLDNDGDLDLVLTGYGYSGRVSKIYENDGTGVFTEIGVDSLTGVRYSSVALGDLDGDGDLDLILTGNQSGAVSKIYMNDGTGSFTEIDAGSLMGVDESSVALGDLDGDGDLDLILTGSHSGPVSRIYLNDGSGAFTETGAGSLTDLYYSSVALGDFDGDGALDLILMGNTNIGYISKIYMNDGSGAFTEIGAGSLLGVWEGSVSLGNINGDDALDLILTGSTSASNVSKIYLNNGSGTFTEIGAGSLTGIYSGSVVLGNLDGDNDLDLILTGAGYSKIYYKNDGTGAFTETGEGSLTGVSDGSVAFGDLDGDGDLDLVLTGYTGSEPVSKIYLNE